MFGVIAYRALPVSDLPQVDYPTITVSASLPGANPDTMASAVATPLERQFTIHRRPGFHDLQQLPGIHQRHPAVRSEPGHRRGHGGCGDGHRRGHAAAAARNAHAALVPQGEPGRHAHHHPLPDVPHHAALRPGRIRRDHGGAAHFHGRRRGPGAGVRLRQVRRAGAGGSQPAGRRARSASTKSTPRCSNWNVNIPTGTLYGAAHGLQRPGQRPAHEGLAIPAHDRRLPERRSGAAARRGQRDRQRAGRQEDFASSTAASTAPRAPAASTCR